MWRFEGFPGEWRQITIWKEVEELDPDGYTVSSFARGKRLAEEILQDLDFSFNETNDGLCWQDSDGMSGLVNWTETTD